MKRNDSEDGSIAVGFVYVFAVVMVGFIYIAICMPIASHLIDVHNTLTQGGTIPLSAAHQASLLFCIQALQDGPIILLILLTIWAIIEARASKVNVV